MGNIAHRVVLKPNICYILFLTHSFHAIFPIQHSWQCFNYNMYMLDNEVPCNLYISLVVNASFFMQLMYFPHAHTKESSVAMSDMSTSHSCYQPMDENSNAGNCHHFILLTGMSMAITCNYVKPYNTHLSHQNYPIY